MFVKGMVRSQSDNGWQNQALALARHMMSQDLVPRDSSLEENMRRVQIFNSRFR